MKYCDYCGEPTTDYVVTRKAIKGTTRNPVTGDTMKIIRKAPQVIYVCGNHRAQVQGSLRIVKPKVKRKVASGQMTIEDYLR